MRDFSFKFFPLLLLSHNFRYVGPRDGNPLRGLIQDHIVSGVLMTKKDTFFTKDEFCQIFYVACWKIHPNVPIKIPPPAILVPRRLWTGKQLITYVERIHSKFSQIFSVKKLTCNFPQRCDEPSSYRKTEV